MNRIRRPHSPLMGGLFIVGGTVLCSLAIQGILETAASSAYFLSQGLWVRLVESLGGKVTPHPAAGGLTATPSFVRIVLGNLGSSLLFWMVGSAWISHQRKIALTDALGIWGVRGWSWTAIPAIWELLRVAAPILGAGAEIVHVLQATAPLWMGLALGGWLATFAILQRSESEKPTDDHSSNRRWFVATTIAALIYVVVFTAMNWQLYRNLLVPHGDSAMYEEHLWNFTQGKGFRSYQEDRLFLGEHIQVVHLLLLPLHAIWPSLMMLDLCESLALASGAIPIYWMTRRHAGSAKCAFLVAVAYLLYFPMQFLDIAIDLKTFRPIAFGVPAVLFGLDQWERGRIKSALLCFLIALSAKEDYAIILAPLGVWIAFFSSANGSEKHSRRKILGLGLGMAAGFTLYLALVVKYVIPWFRSGVQVHYVGYFQQFGSSLDEVVKNIVGNPQLLFSELLSGSTVIYAASLLVPLGGLALFSPSRLLVALPLFGLLCLNQIDRTPQHHFHAPLVPILFWAASAGVGKFPGVVRKERHPRATIFAGSLAAFSALSTGIFYSAGPLGIGLWDPNSDLHWKKRYVVSERAKAFEIVSSQIPKSARVFSTDFVHPRFTHHERSYDYSSFDRASDQELIDPIPGETYYLVIDTRHRYSMIQSPEDIPEYRENRDDWELLPDQTGGYFIVLRRRE